LAPIAPGLVQPINVVDYRLLAPGDTVEISHNDACVLAFDGEREIGLPPGSTLHLRFNPAGPRVIEARRAIEIAARAGFFRRDGVGPED
jgi:hypothetical protein